MIQLIGGIRVKCISCDHEMKVGQIYLKGTVGGFLTVGFSYKNCYFAAEGEERNPILILENDDKSKGFYCGHCGLVVFKSDLDLKE